MTDKELEQQTSLYFRIRLNSFKEAIWTEASLTESQRSCMLDKMRQIEEIIQRGCYA